MEGENNVLPIEDLMDAELDDLQDWPEFVVPPMGHYILGMTMERKSVNDKPCIEASFVVKETKELANSSETPSQPGTKFSQLFMMDNEFGQGGFKKFIKPIAAGLGVSKVSQIMEACKSEIQIMGTLKHRYKKDEKNLPVDERTKYADVQNAELV